MQAFADCNDNVRVFGSPKVYSIKKIRSKTDNVMNDFVTDFGNYCVKSNVTINTYSCMLLNLFQAFYYNGNNFIRSRTDDTYSIEIQNFGSSACELMSLVISDDIENQKTMVISIIIIPFQDDRKIIR